MNLSLFVIDKSIKFVHSFPTNIAPIRLCTAYTYTIKINNLHAFIFILALRHDVCDKTILEDILSEMSAILRVFHYFPNAGNYRIKAKFQISIL